MIKDSLLSCTELSGQQSLSKLFSALFKNEVQAHEKISLVASENVLSPLAKLPFLFDFSARYYLDDLRRFGKWYFPAGVLLDRIEHEILIPLMSEMLGAKYINIRPISGMNCMTIALAGLTEPGNVIFAVAPENGGHASTLIIAEQLGLTVHYLPFANAYDIDLECLRAMLLKIRPAMIYMDQSTLLFPLDPKPIRALIDTVSPETILHYDSSHINGLIIGKATFNPLERGAHVFGGSTHKTLPGPHKGFLATNDSTLAKKIQHKADHFVSHHHPASVVSLTVTLMEMKWCHGEDYAKQIIINTKAFAETLSANGFVVAAKERGFTTSHQAWAYPAVEDANQYFARLTQAGIITSKFDSLPGIDRPALRLSLTEATRMGATETEARQIAFIMSELLATANISAYTKDKIRFLRKKLAKPRFCFKYSDIDKNLIPDEWKIFLRALFDLDI
jgi:glycine hydroxymethyltransferase